MSPASFHGESRLTFSRTPFASRRRSLSEANPESVLDRPPRDPEGPHQPREWPPLPFRALSRFSFAFDLVYRTSPSSFTVITNLEPLSIGPTRDDPHSFSALDQMKQECDRRNSQFVLSTFIVIPPRAGPRHPNRQRRRRLLLHALDEHRRDAECHRCLQSGHRGLRKEPGPCHGG